LRYTLDYKLQYTGYLAILEEYYDVNWMFDTKVSKSISGYVFTLSGEVVSWKSSKQMCVTRSMMKSKFITFDKVEEEGEWIYNFLEDILC
jgi:hypothetical protein